MRQCNLWSARFLPEGVVLLTQWSYELCSHRKKCRSIFLYQWLICFEVSPLFVRLLHLTSSTLRTDFDTVVCGGMRLPDVLYHYIVPSIYHWADMFYTAVIGQYEYVSSTDQKPGWSASSSAEVTRQLLEASQARPRIQLQPLYLRQWHRQCWHSNSCSYGNRVNMPTLMLNSSCATILLKF